MKNLILWFALAFSVCAETRAYWWHQTVPPPIATTIATGVWREFVACMAADETVGVEWFSFVVRYRAGGEARVEERVVRVTRAAGIATATAVFEVAGATGVEVTVQPLSGGVIGKAWRVQ